MALGGMPVIDGRSPQGATFGLDNPARISANRGRGAERRERLKHAPVRRRKREDIAIAVDPIVIGEPDVAIASQYKSFRGAPTGDGVVVGKSLQIAAVSFDLEESYAIYPVSGVQTIKVTVRAYN